MVREAAPRQTAATEMAAGIVAVGGWGLGGFDGLDAALVAGRIAADGTGKQPEVVARRCAGSVEIDAALEALGRKERPWPAAALAGRPESGGQAHTTRSAGRTQQTRHTARSRPADRR